MEKRWAKIPVAASSRPIFDDIIWHPNLIIFRCVLQPSLWISRMVFRFPMNAFYMFFPALSWYLHPLPKLNMAPHKLALNDVSFHGTWSFLRFHSKLTLGQSKVAIGNSRQKRHSTSINGGFDRKIIKLHDINGGFSCFQRGHEPMGRGSTTSQLTQPPSQPRWRQPQARGTSWDIFVSRVSDRWKLENQSSRGASDSLKTQYLIEFVRCQLDSSNMWQPGSSFFQGCCIPQQPSPIFPAHFRGQKAVTLDFVPEAKDCFLVPGEERLTSWWCWFTVLTESS